MARLSSKEARIPVPRYRGCRIRQGLKLNGPPAEGAGSQCWWSATPIGVACTDTGPIGRTIGKTGIRPPMVPGSVRRSLVGKALDQGPYHPPEALTISLSLAPCKTKKFPFSLRKPRQERGAGMAPGPLTMSRVTRA